MALPGSGLSGDGALECRRTLKAGDTMPLTPEQRDEIDQQRSNPVPTRRATVPALEEILYEAFPVLDHGFVRVIDYMGDDGAVVQAARVSYGRGTKKVSEDAGLIRYLMRHWHSTPFEMCEIKYHVKLPIFVARQWIRHRTANVNEYSCAIFDPRQGILYSGARTLVSSERDQPAGPGRRASGRRGGPCARPAAGGFRARVSRLCRDAEPGRAGCGARSRTGPGWRASWRG